MVGSWPWWAVLLLVIPWTIVVGVVAYLAWFWYSIMKAWFE